MSKSAESPAIERARASIQERLPEWSSMLQDLVRIPSCFENEYDIVRRTCDIVEALGLSYELVPMDSSALSAHPDATAPISTVPGRNNVVVRLRGAGGGRSLILNCHLDIVPEGDPSQWTHEPYSGHIDIAANVIYGRGAMDDKAGAAILLGIMRAIVDQELKFAGDLIFQFVLEDEITGNGSLACLEAGHVADAAFIVDGTRLDRAIDRQAGSLEFEVTAKGRPASAGVSHTGLNAAELISRVLLRLRDGFFALNNGREAPWTRFPSPYQFVIHAVHSDSKRFTIPDEARARCYVTFPPPQRIADTRTYLDDLCTAIGSDLKLDEPPTIQWNGFAAEPAAFATDELRALLVQSAARAGVRDLQIGPSTGISDLRHFTNRRIPCMLYGPGRGFNPHRADEHYHLDDLPLMMRLYLDLICEWCQPILPE
jgi:acetylornithine deacetylase